MNKIQFPPSPRNRFDPAPHKIFEDEKILENILKFLPSMKTSMLVNKTFNKVASKFRQVRDWMVIEDPRRVSFDDIQI